VPHAESEVGAIYPETPNTGLRAWLFLLSDTQPDLRVLDVGCGHGEMIEELTNRGFTSVVGVEIDPALVTALQARGFDVRRGRAESLPVPDHSVDVIICSVVLPYTVDAQAISEWARVLRPEGFVNLTSHGIGYGLNYFFRGDSLAQRFYGLRMLVNTVVNRTTGLRLPGFLGDTVCHSTRSLQRHYARYGFRLIYEKDIEESFGFPRFICHRLVRTG
jgi:SAM-dependent methyltransferase